MPQNPLIQELGNGVTREALLDRQLSAFALSSMSRAAVDTLVESIKHETASWPQDKPLCIMVDQSAIVNVTMTPYLKSRLGELAQLSRGKSGRTAIVFGKGFFLQFAASVVNSESVRPDITLNFFSERDQAIAWLSEILEPSRM